MKRFQLKIKIPQNEMDINNFRLLDVDNRTALPINIFIRIIIIIVKDVLNKLKLKIKSMAYSSQGSHMGQLDFCN
jgi:Cytochrome C oxidase subunit II, periplasmic domain.